MFKHLVSCRNKHIILYFHFHKSEQFWNIRAFYCGQKVSRRESQHWYEVNTLDTRHFDICTRSDMWLLRGHRIVRARARCYQHFQILLPFVQPPLYSECSIITIIDIGIELCFRFLSVRPCHSSVHYSLGRCLSISHSLRHICVPNSEIDLVKKSSTYFDVWLRSIDRLISLITQWLENDENVN